MDIITPDFRTGARETTFYLPPGRGRKPQVFRIRGWDEADNRAKMAFWLSKYYEAARDIISLRRTKRFSQELARGVYVSPDAYWHTGRQLC